MSSIVKGLWKNEDASARMKRMRNTQKKRPKHRVSWNPSIKDKSFNDRPISNIIEKLYLKWYYGGQLPITNSKVRDFISEIYSCEEIKTCIEKSNAPHIKFNDAVIATKKYLKKKHASTKAKITINNLKLTPGIRWLLDELVAAYDACYPDSGGTKSNNSSSASNAGGESKSSPSDNTGNNQSQTFHAVNSAVKNTTRGGKRRKKRRRKTKRRRRRRRR